MSQRNPSDDFVQSLDVRELIPQGGPIVMVSRLEHFDMQRVVSSLNIDCVNFFADDGRFEEIGLVENIAQTCALRQGYIGRFLGGGRICSGVIGGIDNIRIFAAPGIGDTVRTEITVTAEFGAYLMVHALVSSGEETLMEADVKVRC